MLPTLVKFFTLPEEFPGMALIPSKAKTIYNFQSDHWKQCFKEAVLKKEKLSRDNQLLYQQKGKKKENSKANLPVGYWFYKDHKKIDKSLNP